MNKPIPTGNLIKNDNRLDLALKRNLPIPLADAWAAITEPERTAQWIGRWEGSGLQGHSIKLQMGFEEGSSWSDVLIAECRAPHFLRVETVDDFGSWDLSIELSAAGEHTGLLFVHHSLAPGTIGDIGPGWEYYLDQLLASVTDGPLPIWDDYYPAQKEHFESQEG